MKISGKALALCILHLQVYTPSAFFAQVPCRISKERRNKPAEALHADRPPHLGSSGGDTQSIFHFPNNNNSNNNDVASDDAAPWEDNSGRGAFDDTSGVEAAFEETTPMSAFDENFLQNTDFGGGGDAQNDDDSSPGESGMSEAAKQSAERVKQMEEGLLAAKRQWEEHLLSVRETLLAKKEALQNAMSSSPPPDDVAAAMEGPMPPMNVQEMQQQMQQQASYEQQQMQQQQEASFQQPQFPPPPAEEDVFQNAGLPPPPDADADAMEDFMQMNEEMYQQHQEMQLEQQQAVPPFVEPPQFPQEHQFSAPQMQQQEQQQQIQEQQNGVDPSSSLSWPQEMQPNMQQQMEVQMQMQDPPPEVVQVPPDVMQQYQIMQQHMQEHQQQQEFPVPPPQEMMHQEHSMQQEHQEAFPAQPLPQPPQQVEPQEEHQQVQVQQQQLNQNTPQQAVQQELNQQHEQQGQQQQLNQNTPQQAVQQQHVQQGQQQQQLGYPHQGQETFQAISPEQQHQHQQNQQYQDGPPPPLPPQGGGGGYQAAPQQQQQQVQQGQQMPHNNEHMMANIPQGSSSNQQHQQQQQQQQPPPPPQVEKVSFVPPPPPKKQLVKCWEDSSQGGGASDGSPWWKKTPANVIEQVEDIPVEQHARPPTSESSDGVPQGVEMQKEPQVQYQSDEEWFNMMKAKSDNDKINRKQEEGESLFPEVKTIQERFEMASNKWKSRNGGASVGQATTSQSVQTPQQDDNYESSLIKSQSERGGPVAREPVKKESSLVKSYTGGGGRFAREPVKEADKRRSGGFVGFGQQREPSGNPPSDAGNSLQEMKSIEERFDAAQRKFESRQGHSQGSSVGATDSSQESSVGATASIEERFGAAQKKWESQHGISQGSSGGATASSQGAHSNRPDSAQLQNHQQKHTSSRTRGSRHNPEPVKESDQHRSAGFSGFRKKHDDSVTKLGGPSTANKSESRGNGLSQVSSHSPASDAHKFSNEGQGQESSGRAPLRKSKQRQKTSRSVLKARTQPGAKIQGARTTNEVSSGTTDAVQTPRPVKGVARDATKTPPKEVVQSSGQSRNTTESSMLSQVEDQSDSRPSPKEASTSQDLQSVDKKVSNIRDVMSKYPIGEKKNKSKKKKTKKAFKVARNKGRGFAKKKEDVTSKGKEGSHQCEKSDDVTRGASAKPKTASKNSPRSLSEANDSESDITNNVEAESFANKTASLVDDAKVGAESKVGSTAAKVTVNEAKSSVDSKGGVKLNSGTDSDENKMKIKNKRDSKCAPVDEAEGDSRRKVDSAEEKVKPDVVLQRIILEAATLPVTDSPSITSEEKNQVESKKKTVSASSNSASLNSAEIKDPIVLSSNAKIEDVQTLLNVKELRAWEKRLAQATKDLQLKVQVAQRDIENRLAAIEKGNYAAVAKSLRRKKTLPEVLVQGTSLRTWSFAASSVDRVQVEMKTEGRPLHADVELWQGPDNMPCKMRVYVEDGKLRPFHTVLETPRGPNTVAIRNIGQTEFPIGAYVETADEVDACPVKYQGGKPSEIKVQGGSIKAYPFDPNVNSVLVYLKTDGRPLNARVELLQGPNNVKQSVEIYSEDGIDRPLHIIMQTPGSGNVVRVVNTAPVEFPLAAWVEPKHVGILLPDLDVIISGEENLPAVNEHSSMRVIKPKKARPRSPPSP